MRRTPIAHVIFPRRNTLRPVPEFAWEAVRAHAETEDLDVSVLMPVPIRAVRGIQGKMQKLKGTDRWPDDLEAALLELSPKPTLVRYVPLPRRSNEIAAAAIGAHLLRGPRASRPQVVHGSFLDEGGYAAAMVGRVLGVPSVVAAHGTDVRVARGLAGPGVNRKRRALAALREATRVIAMSHDLAQELTFLGQHAEVVTFTSRASMFPSAPRPKGTHEILFVGRVSQAKGADVLLDAFRQLEDKKATLRFVGPMIDVDVEAIARSYDIADRVFVEGEHPQSALPEFYRRASCLALPSRSEGLPCVVIESLLVGRPVVASDVGGIREVVDNDVGRLVPEGDATQLAAALDDILDSGRRMRAKNLRARAMPFTWEVMGPKLCDVTRSLLATELEDSS